MRKALGSSSSTQPKYKLGKLIHEPSVEDQTSLQKNRSVGKQTSLQTNPSAGNQTYLQRNPSDGKPNISPDNPIC